MIFEIYMASDHAGAVLRQQLADEARAMGHIIHDLGANADERVDYPDSAEELAEAMKPFPDARGVLVCGSGIGISIAANRFGWIRAALCHDVTTAVLCREHNNANVIAFGERLIGQITASQALAAFLETDFAGGRHQARVDKLGQLNKGDNND